MIIEYGAMSSKYSIEADNKLTAYAAMCIHFGENAKLIAIYSPEECKVDSWLMAENTEARLNEVFGGDGFFAYIDEHRDEVRAAYGTIKKIL